MANHNTGTYNTSNNKMDTVPGGFVIRITFKIRKSKPVIKIETPYSVLPMRPSKEKGFLNIFVDFR